MLGRVVLSFPLKFLSDLFLSKWYFIVWLAGRFMSLPNMWPKSFHLAFRIVIDSGISLHVSYSFWLVMMVRYFMPGILRSFHGGMNLVGLLDVLVDPMCHSCVIVWIL